MSDDPQDIPPVLLTYKVSTLEDQISALSAKVEAMEQHQENEERRRLKMGISALGAAVIALGGVIWAMLPSSAQDAWEIIRGTER